MPVTQKYFQQSGCPDYAKIVHAYGRGTNSKTKICVTKEEVVAAGIDPSKLGVEQQSKKIPIVGAPQSNPQPKPAISTRLTRTKPVVFVGAIVIGILLIGVPILVLAKA